MDKQKLAFRVGALSILLAMLIRMICSGVFGDSWSVFAQPELAAFLVYTESGREVTVPTTTPSQVLSTEPMEAPDPEPEPEKITLPEEKAVFTSEDLQHLVMNIECNRDPDVEALLTQSLDWDLTGDEPTILIVHTHGTEAYTPTADTQYEECDSFRTTDDRYNMISIGDELTRILEEAGLSVIHDRMAYDLEDYVNSYDYSRVGVQQHLEEHPSIKMVIDLHRDAAEYEDGTQWATSATVDGQSSAQVMMVVGSDAWGYNHPNWQTNLSIAEKISVLMERNCDGVTRELNLRGARFNHDLSVGAFIAEIGAAGNTHQEAMIAVSVLAEAIIELSLGSE